MELNKFYMLEGVSGSGKTTYAKENFRENFSIYSSDEIRKELWGDENDQQNPSKVFEVLHNRVYNSLKNGENVVYDATNLSAKRRTNFLKTISNLNIEKHIIVFIVPINICVERCLSRERVVSESVINKQVRNFQFPVYAEGWDSIDFVEVKFELDYTSFLKVLCEESHDNPHHSLSIGEHCIKTADTVRDIFNKPELYGAALFHDIGKGFCKTFYNTKGEKTKEAHYYGHQNFGAYLSMFILQSKMNINERWTRAVIIQYHMEPYIRQNGLEKFYNWIGEDFSKSIKIIHLADEVAH